MKILLIGIKNSGSRIGYSGLFHPFGISYISAVLMKNCYSFDCVDLHNEEILSKKYIDPWERIKSYNISQYDIVAFAGPFLNFKILKSISEKIWEIRKDIFQIAGGNMATMIADTILKETKVNCVCLYEGEETIIELLNNIKYGRQWKLTNGIKYLSDNEKVVQTQVREKIPDLDKIPFPDRDNWSFSIVRKSLPYGSPGRYCAVMFASRGCPFSCIFCSPGGGKKIRTRSPENIIEEIKYLKQRWNVRYIRFFDEIFIGSKEIIKRLCNLMIEERLNVFWWCQTQVKLVDEELLKIMKKAGCIEVSYGIESGSDAILVEMKKGITKELAKQVIEMTYRSGIRPSLNLIAGAPSESFRTLKETTDFVKQLNYIDWAQIPTIDFIVPLPNTELYSIARNKGFIKDERKYITEDLFEFNKYTKTINLTNIPDANFSKFVRECNKEIKDNFFKKHPFKKVLSLIGLDHLRLDLIFRIFSINQIKPVSESLLWATIGKRESRLSKCINRYIYHC